jgi:rRNA-processing protein EBP2
MSSKRKRVEEPVDVPIVDDSDIEEVFAAGILQNPAKRVNNPKSVPSINNKVALKQALDEIKFKLPWFERLEVVSADAVEVNVNDDLKLELAFYGQALAAATAALTELERLNIPHRRPEDYYAEMLKSDVHMAKIKDKLLSEQSKIEAVHSRKTMKKNREISKEISVEKTKQKQAQKKQAIENINQWRKHKNDRANATNNIKELNTDADLNAVLSGKSGFKGKRDGRDNKSKFKREYKDKKYGFGGQPKWKSKQNTAASSSDLKGFNRGPKGSKFQGKKSGKPNSGANRPGKDARKRRK